MRRLHRLVLFVSVAATATFVPACEGPEGPAGVPGVDGNANVIAGRDTVTNADWSTTIVQIGFSTGAGSTSFGKPARFLDLAVPQLTAAVYAGGAVLVWMQPGLLTSPQFVQLPWDMLFLNSTTQYHYDLAITPGTIRVLFFTQDLNDPTVFPSPLGINQATRIFRWVIIPSTAMSAVASLPVQDGPDATIKALVGRGFPIALAR